MTASIVQYTSSPEKAPILYTIAHTVWQKTIDTTQTLAKTQTGMVEPHYEPLQGFNTEPTITKTTALGTEGWILKLATRLHILPAQATRLS